MTKRHIPASLYNTKDIPFICQTPRQWSTVALTTTIVTVPRWRFAAIGFRSFLSFITTTSVIDRRIWVMISTISPFGDLGFLTPYFLDVLICRIALSDEDGTRGLQKATSTRGHLGTPTCNLLTRCGVFCW